MRHLVVALVTAALLSTSTQAAASSWPQAGGDASRSGWAASGGALPAEAAWTVAASEVRTPVVITGGGGPARQRVAYGTGDGRVHLRVLATGAPVGAPDGTQAADAALTDTADAFGRDGVAAGFADTSLPDRLGTLYVVHNDGGGVELLRLDLTTGARAGPDVAVPGTLGCGVAGSALLTPAAADGSRILVFGVRGSCSAGPGIVRVPIAGDATLPDASLRAPGYARVGGMVGGASPSLVVLADAAGLPRFYVAVPRAGGIDFFEAGRSLAAQPGVVAPDLTLELGPAEVPGTVAAPATASGMVAGGQGTGTPAAGALYVAARAGSFTHVHRIARDGAALAVRATTVLGGLPAAGLLVAEVMGPDGPAEGGRILAATTAGAALLRPDDLAVLGRRDGAGYADALPAGTGGAAFLVRGDEEGESSTVLALSLDDLEAVRLPLGESDDEGRPRGQPAVARGHLVAGTADRVAAYRLRDVTPPSVSVRRPRSSTRVRRGRAVRLVARAADDSGVSAIAFRLRRAGRSRRLAGLRAASFTDRTRFAARARVPARIRPGRYRLVVAVRDGADNRATASRRVRVRR